MMEFSSLRGYLISEKLTLFEISQKGICSAGNILKILLLSLIILLPKLIQPSNTKISNFQKFKFTLPLP